MSEDEPEPESAERDGADYALDHFTELARPVADSNPDFKAALAVRETIYRLRGHIVSEVSAVEGSVDVALSCYFVSAERSRRFYELVSVRLGFIDKLEILEKIVDELGIKARVGETLSKLRRANEIRNEQAHSYVSVNPSGPMSQLFEWHSYRTTKRSGIRFARIEIAELEKSAAWIDGLQVQVMRISQSIGASSHGLDASSAMDAFDDANPDVAEAAQKDPP